jgi:NADH-quinone oxidoreductase subunit C
VPSISVEEFKERLITDVPGALAPARAKATPNNGDGAAPAKGKKGEEGPVDLLATKDAVVLAERIPEVARYMRDTLEYTFLTDLTAVDYLADGVIELVYRFLHLEGGPTLAIKTRVPRERAVVPSITPFWPGADLQEREAFDLYGVDFPGHPNLKRVKQGDKYLDDDEE